MKEKGSVPTIHGLTVKRPAKAPSFEQTKQVVTFSQNYITEHWRPVAAAPRASDEHPLYPSFVDSRSIQEICLWTIQRVRFSCSSWPQHLQRQFGNPAFHTLTYQPPRRSVCNLWSAEKGGGSCCLQCKTVTSQPPVRHSRHTWNLHCRNKPPHHKSVQSSHQRLFWSTEVLRLCTIHLTAHSQCNCLIMLAWWDHAAVWMVHLSSTTACLMKHSVLAKTAHCHMGPVLSSQCLITARQNRPPCR